MEKGREDFNYQHTIAALSSGIADTCVWRGLVRLASIVHSGLIDVPTGRLDAELGWPLEGLPAYRFGEGDCFFVPLVGASLGMLGQPLTWCWYCLATVLIFTLCGL